MFQTIRRGDADWHDNSDIIGIRYGDNDHGSSGVEAQPLRSKRAIDYRRGCMGGIDNYSKGLLKEGEN